MRSRDFILIAEDDDDDQFLLSAAFTDLGESLQLRFVSNGIELLDHFNTHPDQLPALLIVDLNMPRKNGREAISQLRTSPFYNSFPTVIFSTTDNEIEKKRCRALGVKDFIVKPSTYSGLLKVVRRFQAYTSESMQRLGAAQSWTGISEA